jgi:hypothetical protein
MKVWIEHDALGIFVWKYPNQYGMPTEVPDELLEEYETAARRVSELRYQLVELAEQQNRK